MVMVGLAAIVGWVLALVCAFGWIMSRSKADGTKTRSGESENLQSKLEQALTLAETANKGRDELRGKLDKARDDLKRAKKKAYEADRASKSGDPEMSDEEAELRRGEVELAKLRAEAKQAASDQAKQMEQIQQELDGVKKERDEVKKALSERVTQAPPVQESTDKPLAPLDEPEKKTSPDSPASENESNPPSPSASAGGPDVNNLESELKKVRGQIKAARKKERNDSQVYRVTKSKLELAMDKIDMLEKQLSKSPPA